MRITLSARAANTWERGCGDCPPGSANTLHKHLRSEEFYVVLEDAGRLRVGEDTLTVPQYGGVWGPPESLR